MHIQTLILLVLLVQIVDIQSDTTSDVQQGLSDWINSVSKSAEETQKRITTVGCLRDSSCPSNSGCGPGLCVCDDGYVVAESRKTCNSSGRLSPIFVTYSILVLVLLYPSQFLV